MCTLLTWYYQHAHLSRKIVLINTVYCNAVYMRTADKPPIIKQLNTAEATRALKRKASLRRKSISSFFGFQRLQEFHGSPAELLAP